MKGIILVFKHINTFFLKLSEDRVPSYSAQAAFFIIISFFPFAMLVLTLLNYMPFSLNGITNFSINFLSPSFSEFVNSLILEIKAKASGAVISITSITALWSASTGLLAIVKGLNCVYGVKEKRGYIKLRLTILFYMLVMIIIIVITLGLLVFGGSIMKWFEANIVGFGDFTSMFLKQRWLIALCLLTLFFMFLYTVIPERKTKFISEFVGAIFSAIGWILFSALYSFYVERNANYSYLYGSLTTVVLLMLWLYFCMYILFLGAEINNFMQEKKLNIVIKKRYNDFRKWKNNK